MGCYLSILRVFLYWHLLGLTYPSSTQMKHSPQGKCLWYCRLVVWVVVRLLSLSRCGLLASLPTVALFA